MARIILSSILNDIRGSTGSSTFSVWRGIHYMKAKASVVANPNSSKQADVRIHLSASVARWFAVLTEAQRNGWEEFAKQLGSASNSDAAQGGGQLSIIPKNRNVMSGFNAYTMTNQILFTAGILAIDAFQDDAILGANAPNAPFNVNIMALPTPGDQGFRIDLAVGVRVGAQSRIRGWIRSTQLGVHRQQTVNVDAFTTEIDVDTVSVAAGALIDPPLGLYQVALEVVGSAEDGNENAGLRSSPSVTLIAESVIAP